MSNYCEWFCGGMCSKDDDTCDCNCNNHIAIDWDEYEDELDELEE